jgi:DNA-binding MarR family transcriptional regulator
MLNLLHHRTKPASEDAVPAEVLDTVERLFMRAARRLLFEDDADSPLWDLPLPQIRALHMIAWRRNCAVGHLAERLGVAMSTATQIADRLEQRGWVRRVDDPEDRRVVRLALTAEGQDIVEQRRRQRRQHLLAALAEMPPASVEALVEGLRALHDFGGLGGERSCRGGSSLLNWVREELEVDPAAGEERPSS